MQRERDLLAAILDQMPAAVVVTDPEGRLRACNARAEEMLQRRPGETPGLACSELIGCGWESPHTCKDQCGLKSALEGGPALNRRVSAHRPDGSVVRLESDGQPLRDGAGAVRGGILVLREPPAQMKQARRLQERLLQLPGSLLLQPGSVRVDIEAYNAPSVDVGGDFCRVLQPHSSRLVAIVGDVLGKDLSAAIVMSLALGSFEEAVQQRLSPGQVLKHINEHLYRLVGGEPQAFVTALVVEVDAATRMLRVARAGHEPPLLLRRGTCRSLSQHGSLPLGILPDHPWPELMVPMSRRDRLFLYTDGLLELEGRGRPVLSRRGLRLLLQRIPPSCMVAEVRRWAEKAPSAADDVTFLVLDIVCPPRCTVGSPTDVVPETERMGTSGKPC